MQGQRARRRAVGHFGDALREHCGAATWVQIRQRAGEVGLRDVVAQRLCFRPSFRTRDQGEVAETIVQCGQPVHQLSIHLATQSIS